MAARPPRICAASGETACQAARVSPSRPHSHASRWRAGTSPAPTPGPVRSSASVGAVLVAARLLRICAASGGNSVSGGPRVSKSATQPCLQMAGGDKPRPYARACAVIRICRGGPCGRPAAADLCRFGGKQRVRRPACLQVGHTAMPPDGGRGQAPPLRPGLCGHPRL